MPQLPIPPQEATKIILSKLPTRRMRDVIERRFGLKGSKKHTLEAIGKEYKITRERVRQIEADALKHLGKDEALAPVEPGLRAMEEHIKEHGEVMSEPELFTTLAESRYRPHIALLLSLGKQFHRLPETERYLCRWTINKVTASTAEKVMSQVVEELDKKGCPVNRDTLGTLVAERMREVMGKMPEEQVGNCYLNTSKLIRKNPFGEYGLVSWSAINPRGVRDKAYVVLARKAKPLHFREVAKAIDEAGWSKKRAHPQTVHNELIKDNRFVLVGRGLYALREWGYEPGVVRDVVVSVLKSAGRPLTSGEIVKMVLEKRLVKEPTVLLNLQNKSLFKRTDDGKYTLV